MQPSAHPPSTAFDWDRRTLRGPTDHQLVREQQRDRAQRCHENGPRVGARYSDPDDYPGDEPSDGCAGSSNKTATMGPPGTESGTIHLANSAAATPTNIQEMSPTFCPFR
jgi:hypothetical protein